MEEELDEITEKDISSEQASKISGYAKDYIGQLCRTNRLKGRLIGRSWIVNIDDLLAYKEEQKKKVREIKNIYSGEPKKIKITQLLQPLAAASLILALIMSFFLFSDEVKAAYNKAENILKTVSRTTNNLVNSLENGAGVVGSFTGHGILLLENSTKKFTSLSFTLPQVKIPKPDFSFVRHSVANISNSFSLVSASAVIGSTSDFVFTGISGSAKNLLLFTHNLFQETVESITMLPQNFKEFGYPIAENVKQSVLHMTDLSFVRHSVANTAGTAISFFSFFDNGIEAISGVAKDVADAWIMSPQNISELAQEFFGQETSIVVVVTPTPSVEKTSAVSPLTSDVAVTKTVVEKTIERIISGLTSEELDAKLNQLNSQILSQISGLKNELASQISANQNSIALTNRINNLGNVTISNPTFSGTVSGLTDADIPDNITASNYLALSGGTLTGALNIGGSTDITGDLTVGGNTIVINGQINVGDKVITQGDIGVGTSTPMAKFTIQATDTATTSMVIWGIASQTLPHLRIFNNSGAEQLTFTADAKLGIGTSTPLSKLSVAGRGWFDDYVTSSYFTATSTTATSTFPYLTSTGLQISSWLDFPANSITDAMIPDTITASNYLSLANWYATTTHALISSLPSLSITESQISDLTHFTNNDWDIRMTGTTTLPSITTLANLATVGTITSGTWGGTTIAVNKGGTGLTSGYNNTNWDTAYGWGNHASAGYLLGSNYYATTTHPFISSLPSLSITKSQVSDFGTYENPLTFNYPLSRSVNAISTVATSSLNLLVNSFASSNISQWTNNSNFITLGSLSSTATGLTYTSGTGVLSLTSGYLIPTTAMQTSWNNKWDLASTTIGVAYGGTGLTSYTLGDVLYASGTGTLAGTSTPNLKTTLKLNLVENTALSAWAGTSNITTLGTISAGTWSGTTIAVNKGGTGLTSYPLNQLLYASGTGTIGQIATSSLGLLTTNVGEGTNQYYTDARARAALSSTATGLTYTSGTGVFSLTSGYLIPTTAMQTSWNNKWDLASTTIANAYLANSTIGLTSSGSITVGTSPISLGGTSALNLNMANANTWTALQTFGNASTTQISSTGSAYFATASGNVGIGTTGPASIGAGGSPRILQLHNTGATSAVANLILSNQSVNSGEWVGEMDFGTTGTASSEKRSGIIASILEAASATNISAGLSFWTNNAGTIGERVRIDKSGNVGIGTTGPVGKFDIKDGSFFMTDADVAHGITGYMPTSAFLGMFNYSSTGGGAVFQGASDADFPGILLEGVIGLNAPTATTPSIQLRGQKKAAAGTGVVALSATDTLLRLDNYTTTGLVTILGSGNVGIGTTGPESRLQVTGGGLCVGSDANCNTDNNTEGVVYSSATLMSIYDVAENYPSKDTTLKDGEIVSLDSSQNGPFVKRAQTGETLLGAISKDPAVLLGGFNGQQYKEEHQVAVTLSGRILVDVVLEGEEIKQGDKISLSSIPGIGKKAEGNEQTIGIALEKFDKNSSPEYFLDIENNPNLQGRAEKIREIFGLESGRQIPVAKILVFINLGQSRLTINEEPTVISMQEEIKQMKLDIEEIASSQSSVAGSNQNLIDLVLSYFESLGARITDGVAYFKNLVAETLTIGSREKPTGITLYDEETGEPYCVKIKSGQMVSVPGECRNSEPTSEPTSDIGLDPIPSSSPEPTSTELLEPTLSPEATPSPSITPEPLPDQTATSTNIIL